MSCFSIAWTSQHIDSWDFLRTSDNIFYVLFSVPNRSDPKKRFKFFLKATQIDTVIEKLNDCSSHYSSAKKQLEYQKNVVVSLKEERDKVQTKFNSLQSIGFLKVRTYSFQNSNRCCWVESFNTKFQFTISENPKHLQGRIGMAESWKWRAPSTRHHGHSEQISDNLWCSHGIDE